MVKQDICRYLSTACLNMVSSMTLVGIVLLLSIIHSCGGFSCIQKRNLTSESGNITLPMQPNLITSDINNCWNLIGPSNFTYDAIVVHVKDTKYNSSTSITFSDVPFVHIENKIQCIVYISSNITCINKVIKEFPRCKTSLYLTHLKTPPVEIKLTSYSGSYPLWQDGTFKIDLRYKFLRIAGETTSEANPSSSSSSAAFVLCFVLGFLLLASLVALVVVIRRKKSNRVDHRVHIAQSEQMKGLIERKTNVLQEQETEITEDVTVDNAGYEPIDKNTNVNEEYAVVDKRKTTQINEEYAVVNKRK